MGEEAAIARVEEPVTVASLAGDLRELGVEAGNTLLVHASLSSLGWVCGGAQAVVDALQEVLTESGTLVMPTHTGQLTDPEAWSNPPVPDDWVDQIRAKRPPYRPAVTPTRSMGAVPECFRTYPGAVRSDHPHASFAAWGEDAEAVVADHRLDSGLGEGSPLAEVYERDGEVLLLGVGHEVNTSYHLAEYRAEIPTETLGKEARVLREGEPVRVEFEDIEWNGSDFGELGEDFDLWNDPSTGTVGAASGTLASQRRLVDFAVEWLETNR